MPGKKKKSGKKKGGANNKEQEEKIAAENVAKEMMLQQLMYQEENNNWPPKELFEFVTIDEVKGVKYPVRGHETQYVEYMQYSSIDELQDIIDMMSADLSEPYPVFTYRYFIDNWPDLCWLVKLKDEADPSFCKMIGAITCKAAVTPKNPRNIRGYVAMLAVHKAHRKEGLGSKLVMLAIDTMKKKGCTEVVLETEMTNPGALSLYEGLGFVREKRLDRYYQQGTDAFRLKLWLAPPDFLY
eukprot:TRINITY_DN17197_c0_g1_i1.p1 TRINITY_DN17197_c0_g1~~TRINITY_DN17197_c0_g1_i1.p1  ORF type:complete len:241 (+),score=53.59 TRINITY_DN17197_c0_g1_i1:39-761(+)